jgi:uncharacterized RDD family membrane protein YckC
MAPDQQQFVPPTYAPLHPSPVALPPARTQPRYLTVEYAGFWRRFVAAWIDGLLLGVVYLVPLLLLGADSATAQFVSRIAATLAGWLYFALMESGPRQATLGKRLIGIIVTDLDGHPISFARATGRYFGKILSGILLIGYIMAGFTERKQALHDMIAGCLVVVG